MTRDDIIKLAREAGFVHSNPHSEVIVRHSNGSWQSIEERLDQFAALVAAAEREACAKVCSGRAMQCESEAQRAIENGEHDEVSAIRSTAWQISVCAAAIRARSQA